MLNNFPMNFKSTDMAMTPASNKLLGEGNGKLLRKEGIETFHTFVAKSLFLCKRARPDIQPTVAILATRVQRLNKQDWEKLVRLMKYLNGTQKYHLTLSIDTMGIIKWFVDSSFAVHPNFKSHSGGSMTIETGAVISSSMKRKLNTTSSTEVKVVSVSDLAPKIFLMKLFIEAQG